MKKKNNYYIGIDASTTSTGLAVLNDKFEIEHYELIKGKANDPVSFYNLYNRLVELFSKYKPKHVICEQQYFGRNVDTTIKLSRLTGVVLVAAGALNLEIQFLNPSSWRKIYHKGTAFEKKYKKTDSFEVTKLKYPNVLTSFKKDNDISDAIGIAFAAVVIGNDNGNETK